MFFICDEVVGRYGFHATISVASLNALHCDECTGPAVAAWLSTQGHDGVVLMRLEDERAANKINVLARLLESYADNLAGKFVVVTETHVRFARL